MKTTEFKELLVRSLDVGVNPEEISGKIEEAGVYFSFSKGFRDKVIGKIYASGSAVANEAEFLRNLSYVFYRIALPGIAAIVILLISIFFMEGSLSFDSFLGLADNHDETIICLLTGN